MPKKRKKTRKDSKRRGGRSVLSWLAAVVMLAALGGFGFGLYRFLVEGPYFEIREILVEGQVRATSADVIAAANVRLGDNLLFLAKDEVRKGAEAHPWVREARVVKRLPNTLLVTIEEREPAALVNNPREGVLYGLDAEGYVLPALEAGAVAEEGFPVVTGVPSALCFPGNLLEYPWEEPIAAVVRAVRGNPVLSGKISEIHWNPKNGYTLYPYRGSRSFLVGKGPVERKIASLGQAWSFLERNEIVTRYVDVRFESQGAVFLAEDLTDAEWLVLLEEEGKAPGRMIAALSESH